MQNTSSSLSIKFWGVRGSLTRSLSPHEVKQKIELASKLSLPSDALRIAGFGGNTSCAEIKAHGRSILTIDGGTGIKGLGDSLMTGELGRGGGEFHLLMTHFHWDHLMGLPFFIPFYVPGNKIKVYSPDPFCSSAFKALFCKPFFPVEFNQLGAHFEFIHIPEEEWIEINGVQVLATRLQHPDPCWGYLVENDGRRFCYSVDHEEQIKGGSRLSERLDDVHLLVFDGQYDLHELPKKVNWGHSAAIEGMRLAIAHKISRVLFVHHDPSSSDDAILTLAADVKKYTDFRNQMDSLALIPEWNFVQEGEEVKV